MTEESLCSEDSSLPLQGERIVFAGRLASMTHDEANARVSEFGGEVQTAVTSEMTMLVVGERDWLLEADGTPSQKMQRVQQRNRDAANIRILSEFTWLRLIGLDSFSDESSQVYTTHQLTRLLETPAGVIRGWEREGLIQPVRRVHRLSYFDFSEVTIARRLQSLLASGVSHRELKRSLEWLAKTNTDIDRPLAQLEVLAEGKRLLYRDDIGVVEPRTGQRQLEFETDPLPCPAPILPFPGDHTRLDAESVSDWFQYGCLLLQADRTQEAANALMQAAEDSPYDPEVHFLLGETWYRLGETEAALKSYLQAVMQDQKFVEAWLQLGVIHVELQDRELAREAFEEAIKWHPEYADAHWHLAHLLEELGEYQTAVEHWRTSLAHECHGPWAQIARQRLERSHSSNENTLKDENE